MIVCLLILAAMTAGCGRTKEHPTELYVLAAASLFDALNELIPLYESSHQDVKLLVTYGSSGSLQKQIEQGAPADLFVSAAPRQMKELTEKQLVDAQLQTNLVSNELVVIVSKAASGSIRQFQDLQAAEVKKLAIGHPETVPAGTYAQQAFTHLGMWEAIQPKVVFAKDVRQVLTYVETGNVDAGIVYKTDALSSDKVKIAATADPGSPIVYPVGVVKMTKNSGEAAELYHWLQGPVAIQVFEKYGFLPVKK
ncbi:molybdate ABC transporter substrate-binding protein [Brevibacillus sp. H7]|uniref:molybdate ABC transporter substrate-binding protein n=1 Tax=Brevibacillus sp. H7 TaxID=3349138 RepID=UPI003821EC2F